MNSHKQSTAGLLKFGKSNSKLVNLEKHLPKFLAYLGNKVEKPKLITFSKLSGHQCPFAKDCLSKAVSTPDGLRIEDGPHTKFRCFSASQEVLFTHLYNHRKHNTDLILSCKSKDEVQSLLESSLPRFDAIRIHIGGDFSTQFEFDAWVAVATNNPGKLFYAYTKSLPFWIRRKDEIPQNLVLTASYGGWKDSLIEKENLRYAKVVYSEYEARQLKLKLDHDDSLAANPRFRNSFALLIHGTQPKDSKAGRAWNRLGKKGYSR